MEHGLVAVLLPSCRYGENNRGTHKPERLQGNIDSGYAVFITWQQIAQNGPHFVTSRKLGSRRGDLETGSKDADYLNRGKIFQISHPRVRDVSRFHR
jgi:hypothetical protein